MSDSTSIDAPGTPADSAAAPASHTRRFPIVSAVRDREILTRRPARRAMGRAQHADIAEREEAGRLTEAAEALENQAAHLRRRAGEHNMAADGHRDAVVQIGNRVRTADEDRDATAREIDAIKAARDEAVRRAKVATAQEREEQEKIVAALDVQLAELQRARGEAAAELSKIDGRGATRLGEICSAADLQIAELTSETTARQLAALKGEGVAQADTAAPAKAAPAPAKAAPVQAAKAAPAREGVAG